MSELKNIELLDTLNGGGTSFISLDLMSLELSDIKEEIQIKADKMQFIFNQALETADNITEASNQTQVFYNARNGETLRGYIDVLYDYFLTLNECIEKFNNEFIEVTADSIKQTIQHKSVKTVNCFEETGGKSLIDKAFNEIDGNARNIKALLEKEQPLTAEMLGLIQNKNQDALFYLKKLKEGQ